MNKINWCQSWVHLQLSVSLKLIHFGFWSLDVPNASVTEPFPLVAGATACKAHFAARKQVSDLCWFRGQRHLVHLQPATRRNTLSVVAIVASFATNEIPVCHGALIAAMRGRTVQNHAWQKTHQQEADVIGAESLRANTLSQHLYNLMQARKRTCFTHS